MTDEYRIRRVGSSGACSGQEGDLQEGPADQGNGFRKLGFIEPILRAIEDEYLTEPTDIQAKTIPPILEDRDVIGSSKTGSGKTLAFSCGIIQKSERGKGIQALVLTPTRELAQQVTDFFKRYSKYKPLSLAMVYGGVSINEQIRELRSADIVVATPGRLLDHLGRGTVDLRQVNTLVLDEADMMLDMGFLPDVERIIAYVPNDRQTMLFSATITAEIDHLIQKHMRDPVQISTEEFVDASKLEQVYYDVPNKQKLSLLVHLLKEETGGLVMVFCNTRRNTDFIAKNLKLNGIDCKAIHGGLTQNRRDGVLKDFHKGKVYVLLCTDVAARGLDIKGVTHIYNYDTCRDPKQYIHRIGRTARAGKQGKAITLLSDRDHENFYKVMRIGDINIYREELPEMGKAKIDFKTPDGGRRPNAYGRKGRSSGGFGRGPGGFRGGSRDGPDRSSGSRGGPRDRPDRSSGSRERSGDSRDRPRGSRERYGGPREGSGRPRGSRDGPSGSRNRFGGPHDRSDRPREGSNRSYDGPGHQRESPRERGTYVQRRPKRRRERRDR